jgi:D-alanyl-D-alanine carboxypeptidase
MRRGRRHWRALSAVASLAVAAVLLSGCSADLVTPRWPAQSTATLSTTVEKQLNDAVVSAMKLSGSSGAIVGVWAPWAGSWTAGLGTTTAKGSTPVTTSMPFRIAQSTTSMTCTVLLALVDNGTVGLDDPASTYLPQMTGIGDVTLRQLCQNTSGIGDYSSELASQFVNNPLRQWATLELVTDGMGVAAPGSSAGAFSYSNAGIILLGMALQSASGQSWSQLYQKYVFGRLGMTNTSFPGPTQTTMIGTHPHGYATELTEAGALTCGTVDDVTDLSPSMAGTAGGVISSLPDLKAYSQALAAGALVSKSSFASQWKTVTLGSTAPSWEGYGLGVEMLGPMRGQSGAIPGYLTTMMSDPTSGLTVVVMLNNSSAGANFIQQLGMQLASIASKAPAVKGTAPTISLPWTAEQAATAMTSAAVCQPAAPAAK